MIVLSLRLLLGVIFFTFGVMKLIDPHSFVENVSNFQISPFDLAPYDMWLAYLLPPMEVLVGLCLLINVWVRGALILSGGMILSFLVAIASVWARGLNIDCGCSGETVSLGGYPTHMLILALMLAGVVYLVIDKIFPSELIDESE